LVELGGCAGAASGLGGWTGGKVARGGAGGGCGTESFAEPFVVFASAGGGAMGGGGTGGPGAGPDENVPEESMASDESAAVVLGGRFILEKTWRSRRTTY
tara:strand:- start:7080 stop:7379 length:300 start_codon:yes stop_codon:yes gene_type:complete